MRCVAIRHDASMHIRGRIVTDRNATHEKHPCGAGLTCLSPHSPTLLPLQDAPTTPFQRHFELNLPDAVGEFLQTATRWQSERLQWPALGTLMVQHRPAEEASSTPVVGRTVEEEVEEAERLYSTPTSRRDDRPETYNIRQQIGESWNCRLGVGVAWSETVCHFRH